MKTALMVILFSVMALALLGGCSNNTVLDEETIKRINDFERKFIKEVKLA